MSAINAINLNRFFLYFIPQDPDPWTQMNADPVYQIHISRALTMWILNHAKAVRYSTHIIMMWINLDSLQMKGLLFLFQRKCAASWPYFVPTAMVTAAMIFVPRLHLFLKKMII